MNRRSFFKQTVGLVAIAACTPFLPVPAPEPIGLAALVASTPTTGTVGAINAATYDFWRNPQMSHGPADFAALTTAMRDVYKDCH